MNCKILNLIFSSVLILLLTGCDPSIDYEYYIDNKSDSTLTVKFKAVCGKDSVTHVPAGKKVLFFSMNDFGASNPHDEGDNFLNMFDSVSVTTINGSPIKKDVYKRASWVYDNEISYFGIIRVGTNFYTLELTNEDI